MTDDQACSSAVQCDLELDVAREIGAPLNGRASDCRPEQSPQQALRRLAEQRDGALATSLQLSRLWFELCRGAWRFRDTFVSETRCFAVIEQVTAKPFRPLKAAKLAVLERVLLGEAPKAVAIDQRRAISSVASACQDCLSQMGLSCRLTQASALLTMAACAARRTLAAPALGRIAQLDEAEGYWAISVPRPDLSFPVPLSRAEVEVVQGLVAGRTHAQISDLRATSRRTVANQLAAVFRKLGVSGRGALVHHLVAHSLEPQRSAARAARELRA